MSRRTSLSRSRGLLLYGGQFSPKQLPNLKLWLRADQGVQARGASQFTAASSQYLSVADNAGLSGGDINLFIAGWFLKDANGVNYGLAGQYGTAGNRAYLLYHEASDNKFYFYVSPDGTAQVGVAASTFGATTTATPYFVMGYHEPTQNKIYISVNGGAFDSAAHTTGIFDSAAIFGIGTFGGAGFLSGRAAHVILGKPPTALGDGSAGSLAATIRDTLYNSGNGLDVGTLSSAQRTAWGVVSAWRLQEAGTGTRADSFGGNTLTNTNSTSGADGPFYVAAMDGDPAAKRVDQSQSAADATQSTASKRPTFENDASNLINGKPVVKGDGSDDFMNCAGLTKTQIPTTGDVTFVAVFRLDGGLGGAQGILYLDNAAAFAPNFHGVFLSKVADDTLIFNTYDGSEHRAVSDAALTTGVTYVAVGVRESGTNKLYLNGTLQATAVASGTPNVHASATVHIGSSQGGSSPINGRLPEALIYAQALNASQAKQLSRYLGAKYGVAIS